MHTGGNVLCWVMTLYNTIQYYTILYNTIQYYTILYNTIQYNTIQYRGDIISQSSHRCVIQFFRMWLFVKKKQEGVPQPPTYTYIRFSFSDCDYLWRRSKKSSAQPIYRHLVRNTYFLRWVNRQIDRQIDIWAGSLCYVILTRHVF